MASESNVHEGSDALSLSITRVFDAPRSLVFKAWTDPEHLAQWWGPRGFSLPSCKADFRPGGAYRFHMRGPDGDDHFTQGIFHELVEPERIVYSANMGAAMIRVTIDFFDEGGRTKVVVTQEGFPDPKLGLIVSQGMSESFEKLDHLLGVCSKL